MSYWLELLEWSSRGIREQPRVDDSLQRARPGVEPDKGESWDVGTTVTRLLQTRKQAPKAQQLTRELTAARAGSVPGTKPKAQGFLGASGAWAGGRVGEGRGPRPAGALRAQIHLGSLGHVSISEGKFSLVICQLSLSYCVFIVCCPLAFNSIRFVYTA